MAISAKFVADFSQWKSAVQSAQGDLGKLTTSAETAGRAIQKMSDESAGRFTVTTAQMKAAGIATQDWTKDLGKFDGILAAAGVNISSQVRAIGELNAASTAAAGSMSLLGQAGLVVGTFLAAWQTGRFIAGLIGADENIRQI